MAATSTDGAWHLSASGSPQVLTISAINKDQAFRQYAVEDSNAAPAHISCLFEAPSRLSFFAILADAGEIWELSYDPSADPVFPGFVHNYRTGQVEGIIVEEQPFARRRLHLDLDHQTLIFSPNHTEVIGRGAEGGIRIYNLDSRKPAAKLTDQANLALLDSRFALLDNQPVFILNLPGSSQRIFSTRTWREIEAQALEASKFIPVTICRK